MALGSLKAAGNLKREPHAMHDCGTVDNGHYKNGTNFCPGTRIERSFIRRRVHKRHVVSCAQCSSAFAIQMRPVPVRMTRRLQPRGSKLISLETSFIQNLESRVGSASIYPAAF